MKQLRILLAIILVMAVLFSFASCEIIEGITGTGTGNEGELTNPEGDGEESEGEKDEPEGTDPPDSGETPHEHTFSDEWSSDDKKHWRAATCEHTNLTADAGAHSYDPITGDCICESHIHIYSSEWSHDDSKHWYAAICEHSELKSGESAHRFDSESGACECGLVLHIHKFSDEWTSDDNTHWHAAICGCTDLKSGEASHDYDPLSGNCVCGKHIHVYSEEWSKNETSHWHAAICLHGEEKLGEAAHDYDPESGTCECGLILHIHKFSDEWTSDDNTHWHAAICGCTDLKSGEASHDYDPKSGNCVCGKHIHVYSEEWSKNESYHWHAAICEHSEEKLGEAEHSYIKDVCECGQKEPDYGPEPADIIKGGTPIGTITELFKMSAYTDSAGRYCRVLQGGCTDGRYYYAFFNDAKTDASGVHAADSASVCYKYDMTTKKLVATYEGLMIEHVNDATYVPDTNELVIVHCSPNKKLISIFDAETMALKRQATADDEIYSIAYDEYEKCYWAGLSYVTNNIKSDSFAKLDLDFNTIEVFPGETFGYTRQGMDVDSEYIYFSRYTPNCILVYDKQGNFIERIALSQTSYELENIFHIGDIFYLGYYTTKAGGRVYSLELTDARENGDVNIDMNDDNELITLPKRTDADGNICKVAQCSATDGTYIYFFMNNDVKASYISSVYKYEIATGKIVATLDGFKTGHTNDVTYNPKTNELIVANNIPNFTLTIIDAETLEVKRNITVESDIFAIAYDEVKDCYYGSNRANYGVIKLDSDFNFVAELMSGVSTGYSRQAIDTDGKYIYMLQSAANCVLVYTTGGEFVGISYLLPSTNTAQSICHIGDTFYIGYNVSSSGGIIYKIDNIEVTVTEEPDDGHEHTFLETWSKNSTSHWHAATCEHSDVKADLAAHIFKAGICVCGMADAEPADIIEDGTPLGTMTQHIVMTNHVDASGRNCRVLQGGCTDGKYYYAFFNDSLKDADGNHSADSASTVYKYDIATKTLVATYENIMVEHCNDATYYPPANEILVAHCSPNKNIISVFDADTMELKRTFAIEFHIYAIAYDTFEDCYWLGLSYGDSFVKVDLEFKLIDRFEGVPYGYTRQGMDVDSKYIYFARYEPNCVLVYDKAGNYVDRIALSVSATELENICHIGSTFYLGYYTAKSGGKLYSFKLTSLDPSGDVTVDMTSENELITLNQHTDTDGNTYTVVQGSASDGKYIYLFMSNNVSSNYLSSLYKYEIETGKIVATLDGFKTGQTNDVTYNSKTNELIVVQNTPTNILTIIDAETLEVKRDVTIASNLISIAYDEAKDCYYAVARTSPYTIAKLDAEFNHVEAIALDPQTGYSRQTIDTDGEYIYILQSAANCVLVYRVDGSFVGISYLLPSTNTAQSICHIGDTFYIGYNVSSSGGIIYAVEIEITEKASAEA